MRCDDAASVRRMRPKGDSVVEFIVPGKSGIFGDWVRLITTFFRRRTATVAVSVAHRTVLKMRDAQPKRLLQPLLAPPVAENSADPHIEVQLLAMRVLRDGKEMQFPQSELRLLAVLALAGRTLSRDTIGELLWPDVDDEQWRNNLKVAIHRIRKRLALPDAIVWEQNGYRLSSEIEVDLGAAEAHARAARPGAIDADLRAKLQRIVDRYRSGAERHFESMRLQPEFFDRLRAVFRDAASSLAADALSGGRSDEAKRLATDMLDLDPLDELGCELLIRALLEAGDRAAALAIYRRYAARLADELGVQPSRRFTELERMIR
jgi:DNA-binding SARP family transcriptional activator